jgi:hypothetical protein
MAKQETISMRSLKIGVLKITVKGKTPYMPEPMDWDMLEEYDGPKGKKGKGEDKPAIPEAEKAKKKFYYTEDGKYGINARAFYKAMIKASSYFFEKSEGGMRNIKEGVTILGDILPLKYKKVTQIKHWGRTSGMKGTPRKIIRNAFHDWEVALNIEYNQSELSAEQIVNILNWAGFYCGVGGFRKEKTGNFGMFEVKVS